MNSQNFYSKPIWVDATNLVRWGLQVATGVQRVEAGLLGQALDHDDVGIAIMDRGLSRIEPASVRTVAYVRFLVEQQTKAAAETYLQRIRDELRFLDVQLKYGDASTARRWAGVIAGNFKHSKIKFELIKSLCKLTLVLATVLRIFPAFMFNFFRNLRTEIDNNSPIRPKFVISYELYSSPGWRAAISRAGLEPVHIVYDLIPIHFPELVSKRMAGRIDRLFRSILTNN